MEQELAVIEASGTPATMDNAPAVVLAEAQKAAAALHDVIRRKPKPVTINGETYLEYEDWATVGRFYAVTAGLESDPEYVEIGGAKGFKATAVALRNGQVISRAVGYCLDDEERWAKAPTYQVASMAQTRANAKVLRNVLSWVAVLAGYKPTTAEEMDGVRSRPRTAGKIPVCPSCKTAKQVMPSKFTDKATGIRPWFCLKCNYKWGNSEQVEEPEIIEDGPRE